MTYLFIAIGAILAVWCAEGLRSGVMASQEEIETRGQDDPGWNGCVWVLAIVAAVISVAMAAMMGVTL